MIKISPNIKEQVVQAAEKKILFTQHATDQMNRPDRLIEPDDVEYVLTHDELIEEYPDDARGHSCLLMDQLPSKNYLHVVCAPKDDHLVIITAYWPDSSEFGNNFRVRKEKK